MSRRRGLRGLVVWDWGMVWERVAGRVVCPLIGHRWQRKMRDEVCARCRTSRAVR